MQSQEERWRLIVASVALVAAVAVGGALYFMRPVLVPLVLAVLLSYLVAPVVDFVQTRLKVPRAVGVIAALVLAGGIFTVVGLLVSSSATRLAEKAPIYQHKLLDIGKRLIDAAQNVGLPVDEAAVRGSLGRLPVGSLLGGLLDSLVDSASTFFLVLIFVIYLVAGRQPNQRQEGVYQEIDEKVRRYLSVKVAVSAATGILVGVILALFGLDLAAVFGVLTFFLNFIPNVGSVLATLLPLPVALVQFDSPALIVLVVALPGAVQMAIGNVVEPKVMGVSLNLHPITVLLSLVFWGMLWGMAGMVLAAPITAVLKIVLDKMEGTRPVADLLAGKLPAP